MPSHPRYAPRPDVALPAGSVSVMRGSAKRKATDMQSGIFKVQAQERIVFGTPAPDAVVAEAEHYGADRIFVTSTKSLAALDDGPLKHVEQALGSRHAGTFSAIASHSPREDVIAAAAAARAAGADLLDERDAATQRDGGQLGR